MEHTWVILAILILSAALCLLRKHKDLKILSLYLTFAASAVWIYTCEMASVPENWASFFAGCIFLWGLICLIVLGLAIFLISLRDGYRKLKIAYYGRIHAKHYRNHQ